MTFRPAIWFPIAAVLSVINLGAVWFAAMPGEPLHATTHAVLAVAFAVWAQRLRHRQLGVHSDADLDAVELEVQDLRAELAEAHERLDFAERMLAQGDPRRRDDQKL